MTQHQQTRDPRMREGVVRDRGATAVEYALFAVLVAAVILATVAALGLEVFDLFDSAAGTF